jgi:23S rRNA pseudouridine1911/1915/1917 synthase
MRVKPPPGCDPDAIVLTFPVAREFDGQRLDRFIQNRIPRLSRTRAQEIVKACARRLDGTRRRASERVRAGEVVMLVRPRFVEPETPQTFGILHEDEDVLGIDKPAGLPMHPTASYHKNTLTFLLRQRYGESPPHIAHRLDRETSGVVLCGKHIEAERALKRAFEDRRVDKTYLAIVHGAMEEEGAIDMPLASVREGLHVMMEVREDGLEARTRYQVRARAPRHTLVELFPETGRQHQLRVHLSEIGHPIVGDKLYGAEREAPFLEIIETGMTDALLERLGHERQALHAHSATLDHPRAKAPLRVVAPLAADLVALWGRLEGEPLGSSRAKVPALR